MKDNDYIIIKNCLRIDQEQMNFVYDSAGKSKLKLSLNDLELFLDKVYNAKKISIEEVNNCTYRKIKRYNKYCNTIFCLSEMQVPDEDFYAIFRVDRDKCIDIPDQKMACYRDMIIIIGSNDKKHVTSYYVGGSSEKIFEQLDIFLL